MDGLPARGRDRRGVTSTGRADAWGSRGTSRGWLRRRGLLAYRCSARSRAHRRGGPGDLDAASRRRSIEPWSRGTNACRCRSSAAARSWRRARVHRRRKEKRLADAVLHEALAILRVARCAASARDRTKAELARIGLRPRAPSDLTATERRVAELAATGLFEPPDRGAVRSRTLDGRQRARPRLREARIHSRAELGARMGGGGARGDGGGGRLGHRSG